MTGFIDPRIFNISLKILKPINQIPLIFDDYAGLGRTRWEVIKIVNPFLPKNFYYINFAGRGSLTGIEVEPSWNAKPEISGVEKSVIINPSVFDKIPNWIPTRRFQSLTPGRARKALSLLAPLIALYIRETKESDTSLQRFWISPLW